MPENWDAVLLFVASQTQWRRAGTMACPTGLDYAGVRAAADGLELAWGAVFEPLRIMELEWLQARSERPHK